MKNAVYMLFVCTFVVDVFLQNSFQLWEGSDANVPNFSNDGGFSGDNTSGSQARQMVSVHL